MKGFPSASSRNGQKFRGIHGKLGRGARRPDTARGISLGTELMCAGRVHWTGRCADPVVSGAAAPVAAEELVTGITPPPTYSLLIGERKSDFHVSASGIIRPSREA